MRKIIRRFLQNSKMITGVLVQMMAAFLFGFTAVELPNYLYFLIWCTGHSLLWCDRNERIKKSVLREIQAEVRISCILHDM